MKGKGRKLIGMKEISAYSNRSEATVMDWILKENFPAENVGGIWETTTSRVDSFYKAKAMEALG